MRRKTATAIARLLARMLQAMSLCVVAFAFFNGPKYPQAAVLLIVSASLVLLLSTLAVDNA